MYAYQDDSAPVFSSSMQFGLNSKGGKLITFGWIPNGGKDGAEKEALEIKFLVGEKEISYRQFPVTQAFTKDGNTTTDPASKEMQDAFKDFNAIIVHILGTFVDKETIKTAFSTPIASFKDFCGIATSLLPANYNTFDLDMFFQYQNKIGTGNSQTYLELPKKMNQGKWLCKAVNPAPGVSWKEVKDPNAKDNEVALSYVSVNAEGVPVKITQPNTGETNFVHPFTKTGWFLKSNLANQQKTEGSGNSGGMPQAPATPPTAAGSTAAGW